MALSEGRTLAIFDDLDTVVLMIPLKMLLVGLAWQLGVIVVLLGALLWAAWCYLHRVPMLSLALNLVLTGAFITLVKHLMARPL